MSDKQGICRLCEHGSGLMWNELEQRYVFECYYTHKRWGRQTMLRQDLWYTYHQCYHFKYKRFCWIVERIKAWKREHNIW